MKIDTRARVARLEGLLARVRDAGPRGAVRGAEAPAPARRPAPDVPAHLAAPDVEVDVVEVDPELAAALEAEAAEAAAGGFDVDDGLPSVAELYDEATARVDLASAAPRGRLTRSSWPAAPGALGDVPPAPVVVPPRRASVPAAPVPSAFVLDGGPAEVTAVPPSVGSAVDGPAGGWVEPGLVRVAPSDAPELEIEVEDSSLPPVPDTAGARALSRPMSFAPSSAGGGARARVLPTSTTVARAPSSAPPPPPTQAPPRARVEAPAQLPVQLPAQRAAPAPSVAPAPPTGRAPSFGSAPPTGRVPSVAPAPPTGRAPTHAPLTHAPRLPTEPPVTFEPGAPDADRDDGTFHGVLARALAL